ncbi:uncharacterized protein BO80DRAFT_487135 [Aspergillus ibericus CBS 121593]|uniref:Uncharacterized protein n=1 Tax=Aspergillus ibericus CBS 121593 TaxID=1448316 RepID=A0A395GKL4_9EURO|nr:hypothetical protein BO80DRAFT_487135 [Aspergillus ibericus CBS 121593]RAK95337.1 hypothetical protein BO80DRAFT_487135 [Aspergillus ibericus CBS 121593]
MMGVGMRHVAVGFGGVFFFQTADFVGCSEGVDARDAGGCAGPARRIWGSSMDQLGDESRGLLWCWCRWRGWCLVT